MTSSPYLLANTPLRWLKSGPVRLRLVSVAHVTYILSLAV